ncbi:hypothetical protein [Paenibacillus paeoniae]|uniref:Uncharacterized protein n=1 Tax=Paenibacillus paeoniae TaxID=2292705 RepID=A0A371PGF9_9BACL|nr:hypothetical protein [Paenibacillus paeoniae]REK75022.1 hypothetical protein DX130_15405 [Paenibacillus paeoniae]
MMNQIAKYVGLLIAIFGLMHLFTYISNLSATVQYHPFFPIGGKRQLKHFAAAAVPVLLPVMLGLLLGVIRIVQLRAKLGKWKFNWALFLIVVLPLLLLPVPAMLFRLHYNVAPLINAVDQLLPASSPQSPLSLESFSVAVGLLFMYCFQKKDS